MLVFQLFFLFFYARDVRQLEWKSIYYSFSIRVFSFLILISLLTAVLFAVFSLNFNSLSSLRQSRQMIYENGLSAQNMGYNMLQENEAFTQDPHIACKGDIFRPRCAGCLPPARLKGHGRGRGCMPGWRSPPAPAWRR